MDKPKKTRPKVAPRRAHSVASHHSIFKIVRKPGNAFTPKSLLGYLLVFVLGMAIIGTLTSSLGQEKSSKQVVASSQATTQATNQPNSQSPRDNPAPTPPLANLVTILPGESYVTKITPEQAREEDAARLEKEVARQKK